MQLPAGCHSGWAAVNHMIVAEHRMWAVARIAKVAAVARMGLLVGHKGWIVGCKELAEMAERDRLRLTARRGSIAVSAGRGAMRRKDLIVASCRGCSVAESRGWTGRSLLGYRSRTVART